MIRAILQFFFVSTSDDRFQTRHELKPEDRDGLDALGVWILIFVLAGIAGGWAQ